MCGEAGLEVTELIYEGDVWSVLAHKLNSYLAFRVVGIQDAAQKAGLLKHEPPISARGRLWLAPFVLPPMLLAAGTAKMLDRIAPDGTEALCFTVLATRARVGGSSKGDHLGSELKHRPTDDAPR
jgi:hypothetical protein